MLAPLQCVSLDQQSEIILNPSGEKVGQVEQLVRLAFGRARLSDFKAAFIQAHGIGVRGFVDELVQRPERAGFAGFDFDRDRIASIRQQNIDLDVRLLLRKF
jgi:hypothetical protein